MSEFRQGGKSVQYAESVAQKWFPLTNTLGVSVIREASLNDDLSALASRRLRSIVVAVKGDATLSLDWETALWLAGALAAACDQTRDLREPWYAPEPSPVEPHAHIADTAEQEEA